MPEGSDILFYEGLHGAVVTDKVNIARYADLKIGVVPVINLEWTQKIHRDRSARGYTAEDVTKTILRRMPDYVNYICPQFTETDINFQRVPTVDTSNPFIARWIPTPDESMVVIRFKNPRGIDFAYLKTMIHDSFMSRANSIVIPGGKLDLAMQLILTPMIHPARRAQAPRLVKMEKNMTNLAHESGAESWRNAVHPRHGQCDPRAVHGRGGGGELRASRHADGHGRRRDRALHASS